MGLSKSPVVPKHFDSISAVVPWHMYLATTSAKEGETPSHVREAHVGASGGGAVQAK